MFFAANTTQAKDFGIIFTDDSFVKFVNWPVRGLEVTQCITPNICLGS